MLSKAPMRSGGVELSSEIALRYFELNLRSRIVLRVQNSAINASVISPPTDIFYETFKLVPFHLGVCAQRISAGLKCLGTLAVVVRVEERPQKIGKVSMRYDRLLSDQSCYLNASVHWLCPFSEGVYTEVPQPFAVFEGREQCSCVTDTVRITPYDSYQGTSSDVPIQPQKRYGL